MVAPVRWQGATIVLRRRLPLSSGGNVQIEPDMSPGSYFCCRARRRSRPAARAGGAASAYRRPAGPEVTVCALSASLSSPFDTHAHTSHTRTGEIAQHGQSDLRGKPLLGHSVWYLCACVDEAGRCGPRRSRPAGTGGAAGRGWPGRCLGQLIAFLVNHLVRRIGVRRADERPAQPVRKGRDRIGGHVSDPPPAVRKMRLRHPAPGDPRRPVAHDVWRHPSWPGRGRSHSRAPCRSAGAGRPRWTRCRPGPPKIVWPDQPRALPSST